MNSNNTFACPYLSYHFFGNCNSIISSYVCCSTILSSSQILLSNESLSSYFRKYKYISFIISKNNTYISYLFCRIYEIIPSFSYNVNRKLSFFLNRTKSSPLNSLARRECVSITTFPRLCDPAEHFYYIGNPEKFPI